MMTKEIAKKIRNFFLPTKQEAIFRAWRRVNGDENLRLQYSLSSTSLVLDIGGYKGQWSADIYDLYGCKIKIIEPVKTFAAEIEERFRDNPNISTFAIGLGARSRTETIYLCKDASSVFLDKGTEEKIEIKDVSKWINDRKINTVSLIKINIEGGEYELLERLIETNKISMIENIQIQFHDIAADSRSRMIEIQNQLSATHELTYQYVFVWENWRRKL